MRVGIFLLLMMACVCPAWALQASLQTQELGELSLEELSNLVVTTASGRSEPVARAMSSIYVITSDDIRRSGATTLPEALRLAANLEVARTGSDGWAVTARGFNGVLANKLLVLIDGRILYTPTFSGVFWDAQDIVLEDIDRIEVISGPGGVLWGANAVNGVINILTKPSTSTRDSLAAAGYGNTQARGLFRYGSGQGTLRAYVQADRLDDTTQPDGTENADGRDRLQGGFRSDWTSGASRWNVQGDAYSSESSQEPDPVKLRGANLLGRWSRDFSDGDTLRVLAYYDYTSREQQRLDTADLEVEHVLKTRGANSFLWGAGFRRAWDQIDNTAGLAILPPDKTLTNWNVYVLDSIALRPDLDLAVGLKTEHNTYTGIEYMPSVRLGWRVATDHMIWAAASRALRTPSRFDRELFLPGTPPFLLAGGPDFESEIFYVYELGYKGQLADRFTWSATVYYDDLDKQRSIGFGPTAAVVLNDREGNTKGIEAWGSWMVTKQWRLWGGYDYLHKDLTVEPGAIDLQPESSIGSDPKQWAKLRSALDIGRAWELDIMLRYYDRLDNIDVPAYTAVDARLGWKPSEKVELSVLGRNLTDAAHIEWSPGAEFERAWFFKALFRF